MKHQRREKMYKIFLLIPLCSILTFTAFAENMPQPPTDFPNEFNPRGDIMANLTDEQKLCVEQYGCPQIEQTEKPKKTEMDDRPDFDSQNIPEKRPEKNEMDDEARESMECMQRAMEDCGIDIPKMPERPSELDDEQRPQFQPGTKPEMPKRQDGVNPQNNNRRRERPNN